MLSSYRFATIGRVVKGVLSIFVPRFKILAYHSVNPVSRDPFEVTTTAFKNQMNFLAKTDYHVISLEQAFRNMTNGRIHNKTLVITFDDGFHTLQRFAFPILKRLNFPATVFLPFNYIGRYDTFSYAVPRPHMPLLDWTTIEKFRQYGISYGSHTMSHRNLVELDDTALRFDLSESKNILKRRLGLDFYALAYPFGMFDERVKQVVRDAGYDCALCFGNILSNTNKTDVFEMKREKILNSTSLNNFATIVNIKCDFLRKMSDLIRKP